MPWCEMKPLIWFLRYTEAMHLDNAITIAVDSNFCIRDDWDPKQAVGSTSPWHNFFCLLLVIGSDLFLDF
jgi:hypothetical protein